MEMVWCKRVWMWTFFQQEAFVGTGFHFRVWRSAFTFLQKFEDKLERDNGNLEWISQDSCVGLLTVWLYRRGFSIVEKMFWGNQCRSVCYFVLCNSRGVLNLTQVLMAGDCGEGWCLFLNVWCSWDAVVNYWDELKLLRPFWILVNSFGVLLWLVEPTEDCL